MLRGVQKQMIVIKPPMGSPFERAYFILRRGRPPRGAGEDMVREAHRILERNDAARRASRVRMGILLFGLGGCFGAFCMGLVCLFL